MAKKQQEIQQSGKVADRVPTPCSSLDRLAAASTTAIPGEGDHVRPCCVLLSVLELCLHDAALACVGGSSLARHLDIWISSINTSPVTPPAPVHSSSPFDPLSLVSSLLRRPSRLPGLPLMPAACSTTATSSPVVGIIAHG